MLFPAYAVSLQWHPRHWVAEVLSGALHTTVRVSEVIYISVLVTSSGWTRLLEVSWFCFIFNLLNMKER